MLDLSSSTTTVSSSMHPAVANSLSHEGLKFVDPAAPYPVGSSGTPTSQDIGGTLSGANEASKYTTSARDASAFAPGFLKTARHPLICIFHLVFKAAALLSFVFGSFLFGGWEGDYVFSFVTTTAFLSIDFWTVKNITGRFLVGMRWWNHIKEDGSSEWVYESHTDERILNATDKTVFWTALYLWPACWLTFLLIYLLRLEVEWVLLILIGLALSLANLIGYWKCSKEPKRNMKQWATSTALRTLVSRFF